MASPAQLSAECSYLIPSSLFLPYLILKLLSIYNSIYNLHCLTTAVSCTVQSTALGSSSQIAKVPQTPARYVSSYKYYNIYKI